MTTTIIQYRLRAGVPVDAVIRVYDEHGAVIETHEHKGDFKEWQRICHIAETIPLLKCRTIRHRLERALAPKVNCAVVAALLPHFTKPRGGKFLGLVTSITNFR